jgi:hypothetical protein
MAVISTFATESGSARVIFEAAWSAATITGAYNC